MNRAARLLGRATGMGSDVVRMRCEHSERRSFWIALLVFAALGIVQLHGAFENFDYEGSKDWNAFIGQAQAELTTLRDYAQLPLWNPWRKGGQVSIAQPESMFFTPVTPLAWLFGVVAAFKLVLLPTFLVGCMGMWALAGQLGLSGPARLVPGLVFFGSSVFPLFVSGGIPVWTFGIAILPWLLLFQRKSFDETRYIVPAAAAYAALLYSGSIYHLVFFPLFLGLDGLFVALSRRSLRPLLASAGLLLLGVAFGGLKLVPLIEVYLQSPRELPVADRYLTGELARRVFLDSELPNLDNLSGSWVEAGRASVYWVNVGGYIGPMAIGLALAGAAFRWRATWHVTLIAALFLWMSLGSGVRPSLWDLLHPLPVVGSMQAPARLILLVGFVLALLAGHGLAALGRALELTRLGERGRLAAQIGVLVLTMIPMLVVNSPIAATAFTVEPSGDRSGGTLFSGARDRPPFRQTVLPAHPQQWGGRLLGPVLSNRGNINGASNLPRRASVRPHFSRRYRGEVYLEGGRGTLMTAHITPNVIRVEVVVDEPDVLVVNQGYFPGWQVEGSISGELEESEEGLMVIPLSAGRHELRLTYRPWSFAFGGAITLVSLLLAWPWFRRSSRRPRA